MTKIAILKKYDPLGAAYNVKDSDPTLAVNLVDYYFQFAFADTASANSLNSLVYGTFLGNAVRQASRGKLTDGGLYQAVSHLGGEVYTERAEGMTIEKFAVDSGIPKETRDTFNHKVLGLTMKDIGLALRKHKHATAPENEGEACFASDKLTDEQLDLYSTTAESHQAILDWRWRRPEGVITRAGGYSAQRTIKHLMEEDEDE